uniref:DH domain-containing protein n=1 Tax=Acrobeloides nanus TaxID=290746 RepID=A0A914EFW8_9BILA
MEASTSDEHLSVSKLREKFNNSEVKSGAQEVKSGSFQNARAKFETNGTSQHSPILQHQDKSPPASTQTTTINTNHHHKPPPPLLPKPRPNISETQPINNKTSPVQVPPKPLLKIASTQNENIPPPLRSAPFLSQHQEEEDADESLNFKQVLAKFTTKEVYINGRSLEKLRFRSHGPLETSQNGTHATSEHTPDPSNLNDSISDAETASEADDSSQDEDISDNEDSQSHLSNFSKDQNEIQSPNSRPGSFAKNDTLHTTVINEMRSRGLFKKLAGIGENLPSDIGKVRDPSAKGSREKPRKSEPPYQSDVAALNLAASKNEVQLRAPPIPPHRTSDISSAVSAHTSMATATDSFCSDRSSVAETLPTYNVGDEKENKRLRDLHGIAREFYIVQKTYVELLANISQGYPKYMEECAEQLGKLGKSYKTLTIKIYPGQKNIMDYMCSLIEQILNVHKILLDDFEKVYEKWDSEKPNLAAILTMKADFLKICNQFLKEKPKLCGDLQKFIEEDKEFAYATRQFEDNVLNNNASTSNNAVTCTCKRGISLVMHLDAVHQNVVRYKLLMERYRKLLPDHLVEANLADEALKKLTAVSNTVNGFLADADASTKLLELYRKLQGSFDVFSPGRRLLHEGELQRQTRKDLQQRYLILVR